MFSQEYGVSQYERYPVSFCGAVHWTSCPASALFNVSRRVQIRDGVVSNWVAISGRLCKLANHGLYRT